VTDLVVFIVEGDDNDVFLCWCEEAISGANFALTPEGIESSVEGQEIGRVPHHRGKGFRARRRYQRESPRESQRCAYLLAPLSYFLSHGYWNCSVSI
jgi:hypothetical protein